MTISLWVKIATTQARQSLIYFEQFGTVESAIAIENFGVGTTNGIVVQQNNHAVILIDEEAIQPDNKFHHIAVIVGGEGGDTTSIYIDNVLKGQATEMPYAGLSQKFYLGNRDYNNDNFLAGVLDQVEIYNRALTAEEVTVLYNQYIVPETRSFIYGLINAYNAKWSNKETFVQANWNSASLVNQMIESFNNKAVVKNNPFYADPLLDQNGEQRKFGYIASTTKINDIPVANKRVVIVANDTLQIIDETISDAFGNYRFDSLLMSKKYMITAQFGNSDENTPPEYSAVSADWQTPTEY